MRKPKPSSLDDNVRVLLDTAALIYAVDSPEDLSRRATVVLQNPGNILEISAISVAEIAIKVGLGKLKVAADVLRRAVEELNARVLPYTAEHAYALFELPFHHRDPFDRQIIAQALAEEIPVVTPDEKFQLYKRLRVIW